MFEIRLPNEEVLSSTTPGLLEALRVAYLEHLLLTDQTLSAIVLSPWLRRWIAQLLTSVVATRVGGNTTAELIESISESDLATSLVTAASEVFGSVIHEAHDENEQAVTQDLVTDIEEAVANPDALKRILELAHTLGSTPPIESLGWIQDRFLATFAAALTEAAQTLCPEVDAESLLPDLEHCGEDEVASVGRVWLTENEPGGIGVVEAVVREYVEDPRTFWALASRSLGPCDGERVDATLRGFLNAEESGPLPAAIRRVRSANSLQELTESWSEMQSAMFQEGLDTDQTITAALATRFLRPGSEQNVEALTNLLLAEWDATENRLGFEIDLRVFAYLAVQDQEISRQLAAVAGISSGDSNWLIGQVVGLLWPQGGTLRSASLQNYNPFAELPITERLLLTDIADGARTVIDTEMPSWRESADETLIADGGCTLRCADENSVSSVMQELLTQSTSVGVLELHPRVVGLRREKSGYEALVELREAQQ